MKKKVTLNFFSHSRKWSRRMSKIKHLTNRTVKIMYSYFDKDYLINLNLILSEKNNMIKLNKKYKKNNKDTDVLTFVSKNQNKFLGNILYCDIFFSIDVIEKYIEKNKINLYEHFNHLLIHSVLHLNGYSHKSLIQFEKMKKEEIKILKKLSIKNPYIN